MTPPFLGGASLPPRYPATSRFVGGAYWRQAPRRTPTAPPRCGSPGPRRRRRRTGRFASVRGPTSCPGASSPNSRAWTSRRRRPPASRRQMLRVLGGPETVASDGRADPQAAGVEQSASSAHTGTPVSTRAISSASSTGRWSEIPVQQARDGSLLAGDPARVGVEPDLVEERAIRVRDRLRAHRDDAGAAVAVRQRSRRRWTSRGLGRSLAATVTQSSRRPGNSRAISGSTKPGAARARARLAHGWLASSARPRAASALVRASGRRSDGRPRSRHGTPARPSGRSPRCTAPPTEPSLSYATGIVQWWLRTERGGRCAARR